VYAVDETDLSINGDAAGVRSTAIGDVKPIQTTSQQTVHTTALPFVCFDGTLTAVAFIIAGSPTIDPEYDSHSPKLVKSTTIFNSSGSVEKYDNSGVGSWRLALEFFVKKVEEALGTFEERVVTLLLIVDGCAVHDEISTLNFLKEKGIEIIRLSPKLGTVASGSEFVEVHTVWHMRDRSLPLILVPFLAISSFTLEITCISSSGDSNVGRPGPDRQLYCPRIYLLI
jgi:hypothetical protein